MIIYKVTNLVNQKVYIGQTIKTLENRKASHIRDAFNYNKQFAFHKALRKYGENNFFWDVVDNASSLNELNEKEQYYIALYGSLGKNGYNMNIGGGSAVGYKHTEDHKRKISEKNKGRIVSKETRIKLAKAHKGRVITDEQKQKISDSLKGRILTDDTKEKMSISQKEYKYKMSPLTESDVLEIKELIKSEVLVKEIALKFNVGVGMISRIKNGKTWAHVGDNVSSIKQKLTEDDVLKIKKLIKEGNHTQKEIGIMFGVLPNVIFNIKSGKTWSNSGEDISSIKYSSIHNFKLVEGDVREIKLLLKEGNLSKRKIAEMFKVSYAAICLIAKNKTWSHVEVT